MRCEPHPISGAVYEEVEGGLVRVEDKSRGKEGLFRWSGEWVEGSLTMADPHFGQTVPSGASPILVTLSILSLLFTSLAKGT